MTGGNICLIGYEHGKFNLETGSIVFKLTSGLIIDTATMEAVDAPTFCNETCADTTNLCGGAHGAITVYTGYPASAMKPLTVEAADAVTSGEDVNSINGTKTPLTTDTVFLTVTIGEYECTTSNPDCDLTNILPAVDIYVDYGDGSGTVQWTRENAQDLWRHQYRQAGDYNIFVMSTILMALIRVIK